MHLRPRRGGVRVVARHLVGFADPQEPFSAARFGTEARDVIDGIRSRGKLPRPGISLRTHSLTSKGSSERVNTSPTILSSRASRRARR